MSNNQLNTKSFITKAIKLHGNKYNYSKVNYINTKTNINIICPEHGLFTQTATNHLKGRGCTICGLNKRTKNITKGVETFINEANKIHSNKYDYSLVEYKQAHSKIKIIYPIHGLFEQTPNHHINGLNGCKQCGHTKVQKDKPLSIRKF